MTTRVSSARFQLEAIFTYFAALVAIINPTTLTAFALYQGDTILVRCVEQIVYSHHFYQNAIGYAAGKNDGTLFSSA
jgi:hypothetical protein